MKKVKLTCPICDTQFDTNRRDKIYCTSECRKKKTRIDKLREEAVRKQEKMTEPYLYYDYDEDKFYVASIREHAQK
jgi:hypothetical protein